MFFRVFQLQELEACILCIPQTIAVSLSINFTNVTTWFIPRFWYLKCLRRCLWQYRTIFREQTPCSLVEVYSVSEERIAYILGPMSGTRKQADFWLGLLFDPEDGSSMILRNAKELHLITRRLMSEEITLSSLLCYACNKLCSKFHPGTWRHDEYGYGKRMNYLNGRPWHWRRWTSEFCYHSDIKLIHLFPLFTFFNSQLKTNIKERHTSKSTPYCIGRAADFGRWMSVAQWSEASRRA
jgi:hypothetical protein